MKLYVAIEISCVSRILSSCSIWWFVIWLFSSFITERNASRLLNIVETINIEKHSCRKIHRITSHCVFWTFSVLIWCVCFLILVVLFSGSHLILEFWLIMTTAIHCYVCFVYKISDWFQCCVCGCPLFFQIMPKHIKFRMLKCCFSLCSGHFYLPF